MKGLVIFDTTHGNTRAVAEALSESLRGSGIAVDVLYVKDVKKLNVKEYDFLVLGSPTRFGTMSLAMKGVTGKVKGDDWAGKPFAAFDTQNPPNLEKQEWSAAEKIAERLRDRKMRQLLPVLKVQVLDWKGPLLEGELERTKEYGRALAAELQR
mgnify:FL=1